LPGRLLGVEQHPVAVEPCRRALTAVLTADLGPHPRRRQPQRLPRRPGYRNDPDRTFAGTVALAHLAAEPLPELVDLRRGGLRTERHLQTVVRLGRIARHGEDVAERADHVVEERHLVLADIPCERTGRELA